MHLRKLTLVAATAVAASACQPHRVATPAGMTLSDAPPVPLATLVWVGHGEASRHVAGGWQRAPALDYDFTVEQRRYADHWDSVKTMRRVHSAYDGSAGPRVQVYVFRLDLASGPDGFVYHVTSTLGNGHGAADRDFRSATIELAADAGMFAPFDTYRITQRYQYEAGRLSEDVSLDDGSTPWVKNHEEARLFAPQSTPSS